jgi:hypothetical protein
VDNLTALMETIQHEEIGIVQGPDDVCRKCPSLRGNRCSYDETADEGIRTMDDEAEKLLEAASGDRVTWGEVTDCLPEIFPEWFRTYCASCGWKGACEKDDLFQRLKDRSPG